MVNKKKTDHAILILDESINISSRKGNGILRMRASTDKKGNLLRYSLAYINPNIYNHDNGRVLGYDNNHDYHHRHYMGKVEKVNFSTFEEIQIQFEAEWRRLHDDYQKKKK